MNWREISMLFCDLKEAPVVGSGEKERDEIRSCSQVYEQPNYAKFPRSILTSSSFGAR